MTSDPAHTTKIVPGTILKLSGTFDGAVLYYIAIGEHARCRFVGAVRADGPALYHPNSYNSRHETIFAYIGGFTVAKDKL